MTDTSIKIKSSTEMMQASKVYNEARRDYFLDNLFIGEYVLQDVCDADDSAIYVVDVFGRRFIAFAMNFGDPMKAVYVQRDGSVWIASNSGMTGGINSPALYVNAGLDKNAEWYAGDESVQIGQLDMETENHEWYNMVQSNAKVEVFSVSNNTFDMIFDRFGPEDENEDD